MSLGEKSWIGVEEKLRIWYFKRRLALGNAQFQKRTCYIMACKEDGGV